MRGGSKKNSSLVDYGSKIYYKFIFMSEGCLQKRGNPGEGIQHFVPGVFIIVRGGSSILLQVYVKSEGWIPHNISFPPAF